MSGMYSEEAEFAVFVRRLSWLDLKLAEIEPVPDWMATSETALAARAGNEATSEGIKSRLKIKDNPAHRITSGFNNLVIINYARKALKW